MNQEKESAADLTGTLEDEQKQQPINGIVEPPFVPDADKPHRNTNQLQFLLDNVMVVIWNHPMAWPFHHPVNAEKLNLPDYHQVISRPMDLTTIKKRLMNCWYNSSSECIKDFETIFANCYAYNKPDHDVVQMAKQLEELFHTKVAEIPAQEWEVPTCSLSPNDSPCSAPLSENSSAVCTSASEEAEKRQEPVNGVVEPPFVPDADKPRRNTNQLQFLLDNVMMIIWNHPMAWPFHRPVNAEKLNLPDYHVVIARPMDLSTVWKRLTNCWYNSSNECINDFKTIFANCYHYNKPDHDVVKMAKQLEELFQNKLSQMPTQEWEVPVWGLSLHDNTCPASSSEVVPSICQEVLQDGTVQRPSSPPSGKPHRFTNQLLFLLDTVMGTVWNHSFAWPFHCPVDAVHLHLNDYHEIITRPMDLGTIRKRLQNCWYNSASKCIEDFKTIFLNCYVYNQPEHEVVTMARTLEQLFSTKLAEMPIPEVEIQCRHSKGSDK